MSRMQKNVLWILLAVIGLSTLPAFAADDEDRAIGLFLRRPQILARELRLTRDQTATLRQLTQTARTAIQPLRDDIKSASEQIQAALDEANSDPCAIGRLVQQRRADYDAIEAVFQKFDTDFSAILNPTQKVKYDALKSLVRRGAQIPGAS